MRGDVLQEIADAALPETTVTPAAGNMWQASGQPTAKINPREQTVYQRGRLDLLNEIRISVFGGEA
jgi:hypothetical protein